MFIFFQLTILYHFYFYIYYNQENKKTDKVVSVFILFVKWINIYISSNDSKLEISVMCFVAPFTCLLLAPDMRELVKRVLF